MNILLATRNQHKIEEIKNKLSPIHSIKLLSLEDYPEIEDVEETGTSFEENACLKAHYYAEQTGLFCLADDSGLEIDAMDKQPGVHSARYLGYDTDYKIKNAHILNLMKDITERNARYVAVIALASPKHNCVHFRGTVEGVIATQSQGVGGFGYDAIFVPDGGDLSFAQMSLAQKNAISHRAQALQQCLHYLKEFNPDA